MFNVPYPVHHANEEWIQPRHRNFHMVCCDCGLVHSLDFRVVSNGKKRRVQFRAWRMPRLTAQARRGLKK